MNMGCLTAILRSSKYYHFLVFIIQAATGGNHQMINIKI